MKTIKPNDSKKAEKQLLKEGEMVANRYSIIEKIGEGAYAEIYKARDNFGQQQLVALKIIPIQKENSNSQKENLNVEKEVFAKLTFNKNVVGLKDFDSSNNLFYMVIDLVEGGANFQNKFREFYNTMSTSEIIYYFSQIAEGMNDIHLSGIVHRDIKPQNIMITTDEIVKISDFGISKIRDILNREHFYHLGFEGTPRYSAPEQYLDPSSYIPQSDIYSVGIMLYELATGVTPFAQFKDFKSDKERYTYLLNQHIKEKLIRPRVFNPNLPQSLDNIIIKSLAKDPKYRYENFKDFLDDLQHLNENNNDRVLDLPNIVNNKRAQKSIKKAKDLRYERFFNRLNTKTVTFFFAFLIFLILMLTILILTN